VYSSACTPKCPQKDSSSNSSQEKPTLGLFEGKEWPVGYLDGKKVFDGQGWMPLSKFRQEYGNPLSRRKCRVLSPVSYEPELTPF
jgi:hypothetical protein